MQGGRFCATDDGRGRGLPTDGSPIENLARWLEKNGARLLGRDATYRRYRGMGGAGGSRDDRSLGQDPVSPACRDDGVAARLRAAVQRNLAWMEKLGLIREVTGQGRLRMWRALIPVCED